MSKRTVQQEKQELEQRLSNYRKSLDHAPERERQSLALMIASLERRLRQIEEQEGTQAT